MIRYATRIIDHRFRLRLWITSLTDSRAPAHPRTRARCVSSNSTALGRRFNAIQLLEGAVAKHPGEASITLALAKLLFQTRQKDDASRRCLEVCRMFATQSTAGDNDGHAAVSANEEGDGGDGDAAVPSPRCSAEDAADAYHLAGWVKIHGDDHTGAYMQWGKGCGVVPDSEILQRQHKKRQIWDSPIDPKGVVPPPPPHTHSHEQRPVHPARAPRTRTQHPDRYAFSLAKLLARAPHPTPDRRPAWSAMQRMAMASSTRPLTSMRTASTTGWQPEPRRCRCTPPLVSAAIWCSGPSARS